MDHAWVEREATGPYAAIPIERRFFKYVDRSGECWVWTGWRTCKGYGSIRLNGKNAAAHRVSWEIHNGPIPGGLFVLHHCDNPPCVRPEHLFVGTAKDNTHDMIGKSRHAHGERHHARKLNPESVRAIRARYAVGGVSMASLAAEYGVWLLSIQNVIHGRTWRHVPREEGHVAAGE